MGKSSRVYVRDGFNRPITHISLRRKHFRNMTPSSNIQVYPIFALNHLHPIEIKVYHKTVSNSLHKNEMFSANEGLSCLCYSLWDNLQMLKNGGDTWWRHQMERFSVVLALSAGNSPVTGEFPTQRPVTRSFDVSLICALNKRLSKQPWGWWFETSSSSLWRHYNEQWNLSAVKS